MARYNIVIYCPDTNFFYNAETPDLKGIGGGKTAIIRLSSAMQRIGNTVTSYINCDRCGVHSGVSFRNLEKIDRIECDVLIATTSGGDLDLSSLLAIRIETRLRGIWVHGVIKPKGLENIGYDYVYCPSEFLRGIVIKEWNVPSHKTMVFHHGVEENNFQKAEKHGMSRDPYSIIYFGHPAKGLDVAIEVVRLLRKKDNRFHLDIYGGYELWGQTGEIIHEDDGVSFKGLIGQADLAGTLFRYGFCLALQERKEPFGLTVIEAKRAGVIVIASSVGAYPEIIHNGSDGFLIQEHYRSKECVEKTVKLISELSSGAKDEFVRANARKGVLSWDQVAQQFCLHWDRCFQ
jgi:glycosyltransferase involved in cell wall biosynthesis